MAWQDSDNWVELWKTCQFSHILWTDKGPKFRTYRNTWAVAECSGWLVRDDEGKKLENLGQRHVDKHMEWIQCINIFMSHVNSHLRAFTIKRHKNKHVDKVIRPADIKEPRPPQCWHAQPMNKVVTVTEIGTMYGLNNMPYPLTRAK